MFANRLHRAGLGPLVPLRLGKTYLLTDMQLVESIIGDAVPMKIDLAAPGCGDEAVIGHGIKCGDNTVRWNLMLLHLSRPLPHDILKLPASGFEGVVDRHMDVLMRSCRCRLAVYDDIRRAGHDDVKPQMVDVALVMAMLRLCNDDAAARHAVKKSLKLCRFRSDLRLNEIGMRDAFKSYLQRDLHSETFLCRRFRTH